MPEQLFSVDAKSLQGAAVGLRSFKTVAGRTAELTLKKAGIAVQRGVRNAASKHRRTGKMRAAVRVSSYGHLLDTVVKVRAGGNISHLIAGGVRPHEEAPKGKSAMAIRPTAIGGAVQEAVGFTMTVHNPGFAADPFFERGVQEAEAQMKAYFDLATEQMAQQLAEKITRGEL